MYFMYIKISTAKFDKNWDPLLNFVKNAQLMFADF